MNEPMSQFPAYPVVGMAYVPWQQPKDVYEPEVALQRGTLFPCLDKPFLGRRDPRCADPVR